MGPQKLLENFHKKVNVVHGWVEKNTSFLFGQLFLDVKLIDLFVSASQARSIRINSGLYLPVLGF